MPKVRKIELKPPDPESSPIHKKSDRKPSGIGNGLPALTSGRTRSGQATADGQDVLLGHLSAQYERILVVLTEYSRTGDSQILHTSRIALRRYRAMLRFFRKPLRSTSVAKVTADLRSLLRTLGTARDLDVWIELLERMERQFCLENDSTWRDYVRKQHIECRNAHRLIRAKLRGDGLLPLFTGHKGLLSSEWRGTILQSGHEFTDYLAFRLYKAVLKAGKSSFRLDESTEADLHRFRRKIRLLRYWSEFARSHLGKNGTPFLKTFRILSGALGDARDAAAGVVRLKGISAPWASRIRKQLVLSHEQALQIACKEWKTFVRDRGRAEALFQRVKKRICKKKKSELFRG